jgi:hypothetical protein
MAGVKQTGIILPDLKNLKKQPLKFEAGIMPHGRLIVFLNQVLTAIGWFLLKFTLPRGTGPPFLHINTTPGKLIRTEMLLKLVCMKPISLTSSITF